MAQTETVSWGGSDHSWSGVTVGLGVDSWSGVGNHWGGDVRLGDDGWGSDGHWSRVDGGGVAVRGNWSGVWHCGGHGEEGSEDDLMGVKWGLGFDGFLWFGF